MGGREEELVEGHFLFYDLMLRGDKEGVQSGSGQKMSQS